MEEVIGGVLGGVAVLVVAAVIVEILWRRQERRVDEALSNLTCLS